jgi:hypothetical protein
MKSIGRYLAYIPLLSYLIVALTIDRYKQLREIRFYFIPIIVGILILFIKSPITFIAGYSLLFFIGPFIQIIVLIKMFDFLKSKELNDDRAFILMFLILNVFSFLGPFITAHLKYNIDLASSTSFPILFLGIWLIFGSLFFLLKPKQKEISKTIDHNKQTHKILIASLVGITILSYFLKVTGNILFIESEDYKPEMIRNIVQLSSLFLFGLLFLFLPNFKLHFKFKISTFIILLIGIISLFAGLGLLSDYLNITLNIVSGVGSVFEILFYPALILLFLDTFNFKYRAALLSLFYFIDFFVSDISNLLRMSGQDTWISGFLILLLIGFITFEYTLDKPAVHNNAS